MKNQNLEQLMSINKNSQQIDKGAAAAFAALFKPEEVIGFSGPKDRPFRSWGNPAAGSVYFCINPLVARGAPLQNDYVTEPRNFLIEFDKYSLDVQCKYVKKMGIPYNTAVWSGGKSLQLILSLNEACVGDDEYKRLFRLLLKIIPRMDDRVGTRSRLARIPNAIRENGEEQTLLKVTGTTLSKQELIDWARKRDCIAFTNWEYDEKNREKDEIKRAELIESRRDDTVNLKIPDWIQYVLDTGRLKNLKRHDILQRVGSGLTFDGFRLEQTESILYQLQQKLGLDRDDVPGIIKWIAKNIY
jgi:hypothetical protein